MNASIHRPAGRSRAAALRAAALAAAALLAWPAGHAVAQGATVFTEPPSAEELADILFPVKTRSIVIDEAPDETGATAGADPGEAGGAFGLMINFAYGRAEVLAESMPHLDSVGRMLNLERARDQAVVIEGHTDAVGGEAYNQGLSELRALAVRRYLVSVHGIEEARLHPIGKGESALHAPGDPAAAINRRVEFRRLDRSDDGE